MVNPHSWFHLDVKDTDGKVTDLDGRRRQPESIDSHGRHEEHRAGRHASSRSRAIRRRTGRQKAVGRNFVLPDGIAPVPRRIGAGRTPESKKSDQFPALPNPNFQIRKLETWELEVWRWELGFGS